MYQPNITIWPTQQNGATAKKGKEGRCLARPLQVTYYVAAIKVAPVTVAAAGCSATPFAASDLPAFDRSDSTVDSLAGMDVAGGATWVKLYTRPNSSGNLGRISAVDNTTACPLGGRRRASQRTFFGGCDRKNQRHGSDLAGADSGGSPRDHERTGPRCQHRMGVRKWDHHAYNRRRGHLEYHLLPGWYRVLGPFGQWLHRLGCRKSRLFFDGRLRRKDGGRRKHLADPLFHFELRAILRFHPGCRERLGRGAEQQRQQFHHSAHREWGRRPPGGSIYQPDLIVTK